MMEDQVIQAFAALAHATRMAVFRLLLAEGEEGLAAGVIAERLGIVPSTLSSHLAQLERAGLLTSRRSQRRIIYAVARPGLAELVGFLQGEWGAEGTHGPVRRVLFLCNGNAARSIIAEALLDRLGRGRFKGYSAGSRPAGQVFPPVLELLRREGDPVDQLWSKGVSEFLGDDAPTMDYVISLCDQAAKEACPTWPGQPLCAVWALPDPVTEGDPDVVAERLSQVYHNLFVRLTAFVHLPHDQLDPLRLQKHIDAINWCGAAA